MLKSIHLFGGSENALRFYKNIWLFPSLTEASETSGESSLVMIMIEWDFKLNDFSPEGEGYKGGFILRNGTIMLARLRLALACGFLRDVAGGVSMLGLPSGGLGFYYYPLTGVIPVGSRKGTPRRCWARHIRRLGAKSHKGSPL
jgi:hypothetical protein